MRHILVIDGNRAATRALQQQAGGTDSGEGYAAVLQTLAEDLHCEMVCPADAPVQPLRALNDYHGVAITGSALNVYDGGPHIARQIELARAVFTAGVPFFGSCWGMQLAVTAAGGEVRANPLGREFGIGRRITLTGDGLRHALFAGKPPVFEAITVHRDSIVSLPPGATELARNDMGLQAAEIRSGRGVCWGVQYHPEYSFNDIAATAERYGTTLVGEGLFRDALELAAYCAELRDLHQRPDDRRLSWRHGIGPGLTQPAVKTAELANWLRTQVGARLRAG